MVCFQLPMLSRSAWVETHSMLCLTKERGDNIFIVVYVRALPGISGRSKDLPRPAVSLITVELYCKCSMPEEYDDMVCCDGCDRWFHMNLRSDNVPKKWMCYSCTI